MRSFGSFLDDKNRQHKEQLTLLKHILERAGFQVADHVSDPKESYLYVFKPQDVEPLLEDLSFDGIRIYLRGKDMVCFRVQNKETAEPYGETYSLDIKNLFKQLLHEDKDKAGLLIIKHIISELKRFFVQSAEAEKQGATGDGQMGVLASPMGSGYSNMATDPRNSRV